MVPLVGNYLKLLVEARGHRYVIESVHSSKTTTWAEDPKLETLLEKHDPDLVLISLGSNELFEKDVEPIAQATKKIVARLGGRACLWVGPPAWAKDAGFIATLKQNLPPCHYLDSIALDLPRAEDGRHPTWSGGHRWATAVWRALGGKELVPTGN
jgi:lysophospholipase L1-like esterase